MQMQQTKAEDSTAEVSATAGNGMVSGSASASMGNAASSGVVTFHSSAGKNENDAEDSRAMFQTYVRASGSMECRNNTWLT